ncbi:MAG: hypothetical protein C7B44_05830 [Sulfobacillus thermosulfidooxidans]|nr:MAG: hypothetical protein C7B44_05830 [Sulfobacillus thermosulfidooxidans]
MFQYPSSSRPFVWAHRGSHTRFPENSLAAFRQAILEQADGIECDLHLSRDHEVVIIHDGTLTRTTNAQGRVNERRWEELQDVELKGPGHEHLCRLEDLLGLKSPIALNLELKDRSLTLVDAVLDKIHRFGASHRVLLSSFHHASLRYAFEKDPEVARAALYCGQLLDPVAVARTIPCNILHMDWESTHSEDLGTLKTCHIQTGVYGLCDSQDYEHAKRDGVNAVFLDNPLWALP